MEKEKQRNYGIISRLMYGMAEFYGGGAFVIINTFFTVFMTKTRITDWAGMMLSEDITEQ